MIFLLTNKFSPETLGQTFTYDDLSMTLLDFILHAIQKTKRQILKSTLD